MPTRRAPPHRTSPGARTSSTARRSTRTFSRTSTTRPTSARRSSPSRSPSSLSARCLTSASRPVRARRHSFLAAQASSLTPLNPLALALSDSPLSREYFMLCRACLSQGASAPTLLCALRTAGLTLGPNRPRCRLLRVDHLHPGRPPDGDLAQQQRQVDQRRRRRVAADRPGR